MQGNPAEFRVQDSDAVASAPAADFPEIFQVGVDSDGAQPMAGRYRRDGAVLIFQPQFPLQPGVTYSARFRLAGESATARFTLPKPALQATTDVEEVFPTRSVLPQNQLKLYIHFSAPMSRGGAFQRIHIFDQDGAEVKLPFLSLAEELWDSEHKRLTVLFDPGRIKRGLVSQQEMGVALREGRRYRLVIDQDWPDAGGAPLKSGYAREFSVGPDDRTPLDPKDWRLIAPAPGTTQALTVEFPEALDHALLSRVLRVTDAVGHAVTGTVVVDEEETRWRFTPDTAWRPGRYTLVVPGILEDLAGNKVYTPFDVDVLATPNAPGPSKSYDIPFGVAR